MTPLARKLPAILTVLHVTGKQFHLASAFSRNIYSPASSLFVGLKESAHFKHGGSQRSQRRTHLQLSKGPLDGLFNLLESTAASVTDYITMQPKRETPADFRRVQTQFIAALGDPNASSGSGAQDWGIWRVDPGPRGVYLSQFDSLIQANNGMAPAGWTFDKNEFWIEEYGRIMEPPKFPLDAGRYLVTGGRETTAVLTIDPPDSRGVQDWKLDGGAKLFDVTHLPCRSARYTPKKGQESSPAMAQPDDFPVTPGAAMPAVKGCNKQDYAVLFVIGVEDK